MTIVDAFQIPKIEDLIYQLCDFAVFTTFDLTDGYIQIRIKEEDKHKTAFATEWGLFEFNVSLSGLQMHRRHFNE